MTKTTKEQNTINLPQSNCEACILYNHDSHNPHNYWGNLSNPDVLFIGEAPGKNEKLTGKAFQGRAGKLLQKKLKEIGITNFAVCNVVCCRPEAEDPISKRIRDRKPTATEIRYCSDNLDAIINHIKPKYIAALGATAMQRMKIKGGITTNRGIVTETPYGPVLPIFHPAYILRSPQYIVEFERDLNTLKDVIDGKTQIDKPQGDYYILEELDDLEILEKTMRTAKAFAFDIETTGLEFHKDQILGIGFCAKQGEAYYVPLIVDGEYFWGQQQSEAEEILKYIMDDPTVKKIAHNGKFDIKFIQYHWDIQVKNFWIDTMLLHYVLDENKKHGLKELAGYYFPEMKNYDGELRSAMSIKDRDDNVFSAVSLDVLGRYCAMDCESTFRLAKVLLPELKGKLKKIFFNLYMPLSKVYIESELLGTKIDWDYVADLIVGYDIKAGKLLADIYKITGREFNLNSPQQLSAILFDEMKLPSIMKTASGKPSTSEMALKSIPKKKGGEIIDKIIEYRKLTKMLTTYLRPMEHRLDENNRIHPSFLLHGTVTGRISSKNPNIQNIPRDPIIKGMFIPEKGYNFVEMDFSQAELRVMAYYSKDKEMTAQYTAGEDIHLGTASFIFKLPPAEISKRQRKIAKLVNFGYLYGASARKAHQSISEKLQGDEISITLREAEKFRRDFFVKYTGIDRFIKKVKRHIMVKKIIVSCFGRIRRLPQVESPYEEKKQEALRQGLNALIQGTASDLTQLALVQIHKFLIPYKSRFLFTVHDAIVLEVHKSEKHILTKLKQIMEQSRKPFNFPIEADISVFKNRWGND